MVTLYQQCGDLDGYGITMKVMHGDGRTLLSAVRLCGMDVIPNMVLDICRNLHLIIPNLLRG